jgi:hypothetical protein
MSSFGGSERGSRSNSFGGGRGSPGPSAGRGDKNVDNKKSVYGRQSEQVSSGRDKNVDNKKSVYGRQSEQVSSGGDKNVDNKKSVYGRQSEQVSSWGDKNVDNKKSVYERQSEQVSWTQGGDRRRQPSLSF